MKLKDLFAILFVSILFILISGYYYYYYPHEDTIFLAKQESVVKPNTFTLIAKCKSTSSYSVTPYITIKLNEKELLTTALNAGYDTFRDCKTSSIKRIVILESKKQVTIEMQNGHKQSINLLYSLL